jgi:hypothetical protein
MFIDLFLLSCQLIFSTSTGQTVITGHFTRVINTGALQKVGIFRNGLFDAFVDARGVAGIHKQIPGGRPAWQHGEE